jgi:thiol-disulfide isomerase/thioredoxin
VSKIISIDNFEYTSVMSNLRFNLGIISLILILSFPQSTSGFPSQADDFVFTTTDDTVVSLSDFQDKPIVIDWSATWCPLCHNNQDTINSIYNDFVNYTNFITIYYGNSGDDLDDVKAEKGSYPWTYAYDHTNYGAVAGANNADVWILDQNLNLKYSWDYSIVPKADLVSKLSEVIGIVTSAITSETVITTTDTITTTSIVTENNSTFEVETTLTSVSVGTSETIITTESSFSVDADNDLQTFRLLENPLFLGFTVLSSIGLLVVGLSKRA